MINVELICSQDNVSVSMMGTHMTVGDKKFDIHNLHSLLASSVRMFCCGHIVVFSKRKHFLRPFIDPKFHNLLKPSNPVSTELWGPDLEPKIAESNKTADAGKRLSALYQCGHDPSNNNSTSTTTPPIHYSGWGKPRFFWGSFCKK